MGKVVVFKPSLSNPPKKTLTVQEESVQAYDPFYINLTGNGTTFTIPNGKIFVIYGINVSKGEWADNGTAVGGSIPCRLYSSGNLNLDLINFSNNYPGMGTTYIAPISQQLSFSKPIMIKSGNVLRIVDGFTTMGLPQVNYFIYGLIIDRTVDISVFFK